MDSVRGASVRVGVALERVQMEVMKGGELGVKRRTEKRRRIEKSG